MKRRSVGLGLGLLLVLVMLACFYWLKRQTAPAPPVVDLTKHDGQTIDFSSGRPVVKDTPADKAALDQAVKEMEAAAREVTFTPPPPQTADQKAVTPPKK